MRKSDQGNEHLIRRLQYDLLLSTREYPTDIVPMSAGSDEGKHIVTFNVRMVKRDVCAMQHKIGNMLLEISCIN